MIKSPQRTKPIAEVMKGAIRTEDTDDYSDHSALLRVDGFGPAADFDLSERSREEEDPAGIVIDDDDEFEKSAIACFRYFIVFLMISATVAASAASYFYLEAQEDIDFDKEYGIIVEDIKQLSHSRISERVDDFRSLASTLTGLAIDSDATWPFFTDDNYPLIVSSFMKSTKTGMIFLSPLVHDTEKEQWANYSQSKQHWITDSLEYMQEPEPQNVTQIFPDIFRVSKADKIPEEGSGSFLPVWQKLNAPRDGEIVNFNLRSDSHYNEAFKAVLETKGSVMTDLLGFSNHDLVELLGPGTKETVETQPYSLFLQPIFKNAREQEVVAILNSDISWLPIFSLASDEGIPPVYVVMDDGCNSVFTIKVFGQEAEFVGFGDNHEPAFDRFEVEFPFSDAVTTQTMGGAECKYTIRVYPTTEFYYSIHLKYPIITGAVIFAVFAFMSINLYLYDSIVRRRQKKLLKVAARSEQILHVLYPKTIRDRLFGIHKEKEVEKPAPKTIIKRIETLPLTSRFRLKSYIKDSSNEVSSGVDNSKPIADLFSNATVLFADIAGFTAWSSVREPTQVFTLLETVFRAFDEIAAQFRVFKVETVGDCYVAVTGVPEPIEDHASLMACFAREMVEAFNELVRSLEATLGPETGELGLRVGMHSGPITAGVLRGDKSRFQLFGDTVNTCSRVETTGKRNRIHLSEETAELIRDAGRGHLLRKRSEPVQAKGKGKLQTYWLLTMEEEEDEFSSSGMLVDDFVQSMRSTDSISEALEVVHDEVDKLLTPKLRRLCDWNSDLLIGSLKQIVAHRRATGIETAQFESALDKKEDQIKKQTYVLDEVVEIIPLPEFDQEVHTRQSDVDEIELPKAVVEQIHLYVLSIALMYRKNPFHNFEHASHVAMSVSKLISRIVAADDVLNADENGVKSQDLAGSIHDHTYGITSDPMTRFSVILAALVHDVDHTGMSNAQLVKDEHLLAVQFKNKSVAEQNSTFLAWDLLMEPRFKDFRRTIYATPFELDRFRQLIANTVLATDIMDKELQTLRKKRWETAFSDSALTTLACSKTDVNRKATIVIEHLIQASDVAHTMQHWHIYRKWNERLFEEMVKSYKRGKLEKNPVDFWYEGEKGFFDFYVIPLAKKLKDCGVFGVSSDEYLNYAMDNRREWEEKGEEFVAELAAKYGIWEKKRE